MSHGQSCATVEDWVGLACAASRTTGLLMVITLKTRSLENVRHDEFNTK